MKGSLREQARSHIDRVFTSNSRCLPLRKTAIGIHRVIAFLRGAYVLAVIQLEFPMCSRVLKVRKCSLLPAATASSEARTPAKTTLGDFSEELRVTARVMQESSSLRRACSVSCLICVLVSEWMFVDFETSSNV